MLRKYLLAMVMIAGLRNAASGQSTTVDSYANQLLFDVFREQPHPAVQEFLKLYVPSLLDKRTTARGTESSFDLETHGFVFLEHPFFKTNFRNGKLEFYCRRYKSVLGVQVDDVHLWFYFDTQADGETAFGKLIDTFKPVSTKNYIHTANGSMIAEFTDTKNTKGFGKVQVLLMPEDTDKTKFKMLFSLGNNLP